MVIIGFLSRCCLLVSGLHEQNLAVLLVYVECVQGMKGSHMQGVVIIGVMVGVCHTTKDKGRLWSLCVAMFYMHIKHMVSMFPTPPGIAHMFSGAEAMFC